MQDIEIFGRARGHTVGTRLGQENYREISYHWKQDPSSTELTESLYRQEVQAVRVGAWTLCFVQSLTDEKYSDNRQIRGDCTRIREVSQKQSAD